MTHAQLCCGVLPPGKLLPSPKVAVADPLPNYYFFLLQFVWLLEFLLCNVTKSLNEVIADPTWVQSTIATRCSMHDMCSI